MHLADNRCNHQHSLSEIYTKMSRVHSSLFYSLFHRALIQVQSFKNLRSQWWVARASMKWLWVVVQTMLHLSSSRRSLQEANGSSWRTYIWWHLGFQIWRKKSKCSALISDSVSGSLVSRMASSPRFFFNRVLRSHMRHHQECETIFREPSNMWQAVLNRTQVQSWHSFSSSYHGSMHKSKREESISLKVGPSTTNSPLVTWRLVKWSWVT